MATNQSTCPRWLRFGIRSLPILLPLFGVVLAGYLIERRPAPPARDVPESLPAQVEPSASEVEDEALTLTSTPLVSPGRTDEPFLYNESPLVQFPVQDETLTIYSPWSREDPYRGLGKLPSESTALAVYKAAIRHGVTTSRTGVFFLSIDGKEPPAELLGSTFLPLSRVARTRGWRPYDVETGWPGSIFSVSIIRWEGDKTVEMECVLTQGGLSGGGCSFFLHLVDSEWKIDETRPGSFWVH